MARAALSLVLATLALAGCNNTSQVLDPSALQPGVADQSTTPAAPTTTEPASPAPAATAAVPQSPASQTPSPQTPAPQQSPPQPSPSAAPAPAASSATALAAARVYFAPAIGATETAAAPLARRLSTRAAERGLTVSRSEGGSTTHVLKGYFSSFSDGPQTTVIYVWDVMDTSGNRLHRIQGQQRVATGEGEGWAAVSPATMEAIADRTVDDLAAWLSSRAG